jgi:hypothetical protein
LVRHPAKARQRSRHSKQLSSPPPAYHRSIIFDDVDADCRTQVRLIVSPADFDDHVMDGFVSLTSDVRERFPHNCFQAEAGAVVPKYERAGLFASVIALAV